MTLDFVSEVDRKFYSNNLLTNDDWESTTMDLNDLLGMENYPSELMPDLPDDFPMNIDDVQTDFHDTLLQEYSDSSDSGISSILPENVLKHEQRLDSSPDIKHEPLSPSFSFTSESSESQVCLDGVKDSPPPSPCYSQPSPPYSSTSSPLQNIVYVDDITPDLSSAINPVIITQPKYNTILNSKVRIKPKPVSAVNTQTVKVSQPKPPTAPVQKTVVITPEEFNKLKAEGILKFPQPAAQRPVQIISSTTVANPTVQVDNEIKAIKRQQRMIKNRESASLSRKRKKEYLTGLEDNLHEFNEMNRKLQEENELLKQKLKSLQDENDRLKKCTGASPAKKICLMAVFAMLSLNLLSLNDFIIKPNSKPELSVHKGRQLMSVQEEYSVSSLVPDFSWTGLKKLMEDNPFESLDNKTLYQMYTCPSLFNKTESIRLADQLSGWMQSHELTKKKSANKEKKNPNKKKKNLTTLQKAVRGNYHQQRPSDTRHFDHGYQVKVFDGGDGNIWKSIPRRNDTFYVLSFSEDYFLVPATAHNKTMRPRMSFVMPAVGLNDTMQPPSGNVGMMQIDCEVLNTQLIHVHKSSLPPNQRNTTFYREEFYP
ncbi:unnamed protein product [Mytilus edulis]|uniref:BZIP domain-containing protein n=1 Tax=Mytilus edulis TaxID=6550 RepID=A0A8S3TK15_MYTED|nr:unnamed protein product [Mytilus edulis]